MTQNSTFGNHLFDTIKESLKMFNKPKNLFRMCGDCGLYFSSIAEKEDFESIGKAGRCESCQEAVEDEENTANEEEEAKREIEEIHKEEIKLKSI